MKRITFSLLALVCAITCAFGLVACNESDTVDSTGITLNQTTLELTVGEEATLTATVAPDNATDKAVTWSSDKPEFVTVEGGKVKAVAAGAAVITAKTANDKSATCTVTVKETVNYTVTQTQWEQIVSDLTNPLPFKEQNFTVYGESTFIGWDENNETWDSETAVQISEFQVDGDKYYIYLFVDGEYEVSIYEQWAEQNGYYLQTSYDYWNNAWHKNEYVSDVPCEEDEVSFDGTPHLYLADFEWNNFQYDENEHCYTNKLPIESRFGVAIDEDGAKIYNMLSNVKVYFENGKLVKFTMDAEQATIQKWIATCTFAYGETNIVLPQAD